MKKYTKSGFDNYQNNNYNTDEHYNLAYKRVKRIKGFYIHFFVYVLVNIFIICANYYESISENKTFLSFETFSTALFWGIGLLAHGMSVFGKNIFFGQNWEEKKIQEFMNKEKSDKWE